MPDIIADIDKILPYHDSREYDPDPCTCDPDVNWTCEMCFTHATLCEAKFEILKLRRDLASDYNELVVCRRPDGRYYRGAMFWRWTRYWRLAAILPRGFWNDIVYQDRRHKGRLTWCELVRVRELVSK